MISKSYASNGTDNSLTISTNDMTANAFLHLEKSGTDRNMFQNIFGKRVLIFQKNFGNRRVIFQKKSG